MHQITRLDIDGLAGVTETIDCRNPIAFIGPNDTRKTTRLAAFQLALLGYAPAWGKRPMDTLQRASNDHIRITAHTDAGVIERTFTRKGQSCAMAVTLSCSEGRFTGEDAERLIREDFAPDPVFFDLSTVIAASPEKRREFLFGLCELKFDRVELADLLATYHADAPNILSEAWPEEYDSQTGLAAAIEAFKAALSDTKRLVQERDRALQGAMDEVHNVQAPPYSAAELGAKIDALRAEKAGLDAAIGAQAEVLKENKRINARHAVVTEDIESLRDPFVPVGRKKFTLSQATADAAAEAERLKAPVCNAEAVEKDIAELESKLKTGREQRKAKNDAVAKAHEVELAKRDAYITINNFLEKAKASPNQCPVCKSKKDFKAALDEANAGFQQILDDYNNATNAVTEHEEGLANIDEEIAEVQSDIAFRESEIQEEHDRVKALETAESNLANLKAMRVECDVRIVNLTAELQTLIAPIVADHSAELASVQADIAAYENHARAITRRDALLTAQEAHRATRDTAKTKAEAMDAIVKFLQDERAKAVQEASGSLAGDVNAFLQRMDPALTFSIRFEDERGKACADMSIGGRPIELWGDGTMTLATAAIQACIMMRKKSPLPVLLIDRIETISNTEGAPRRQQLINALDQVRDQFASIALAGTEGVDFTSDWNVVRTGNQAVAV